MKNIFMSLLIFGFISVNAGDFEKGMSAYQNGNIQSAISYFKKSCDSGNARVCTVLGTLYNQELKDRYKASKYLNLACENGDEGGCLNLGVLYYNDKNIKQHYQKAFVAYGEACKGGIGLGCYNQGLLYVSGQGVAENHKVAKSLFSLACRYGTEDGCKGYKILSNR